MKLRNKLEYIGEVKPKGRVGTLIGYSNNHKAIVVEFEGEDGGVITTFYHSLAELNEEWEDYKPTEPLIKDKKIRKAVKAWAEAVGTECVEITHSRPYFIRFMSYLADEDELCMYRKIGQLFDERLYTVAELCGEEEE